MKDPKVPRAVFDTNTVISALLFKNGRLAWLPFHWLEKGCVPLLSNATAAELARVLSYPKFRLSSSDRLELLSLYLPYCQTIEAINRCKLVCRDKNDQMFLDLAQAGHADVLVTGDEDLLHLSQQAGFRIETPESYRLIISASR